MSSFVLGNAFAFLEIELRNLIEIRSIEQESWVSTGLNYNSFWALWLKLQRYHFAINVPDLDALIGSIFNKDEVVVFCNENVKVFVDLSWEIKSDRFKIFFENKSAQFSFVRDGNKHFIIIGQPQGVQWMLKCYLEYVIPKIGVPGDHPHIIWAREQNFLICAQADRCDLIRVLWQGLLQRLTHPVPHLDLLIFTTGDEKLLLCLSIILHKYLEDRFCMHLGDLINLNSVIKWENLHAFSVAASDEKEWSVIGVMNHQLVGIFHQVFVVLDIKIMAMDHLFGAQVPN